MRDMKKMDLDALDELIAKCEDSMVSPFKKKKAVEIEIEPGEEEGDESEADPKAEKPDLSDMDLEELMEMYKSMKDKE